MILSKSDSDPILIFVTIWMTWFCRLQHKMYQHWSVVGRAASSSLLIMVATQLRSKSTTDPTMWSRIGTTRHWLKLFTTARANAGLLRYKKPHEWTLQLFAWYVLILNLSNVGPFSFTGTNRRSVEGSNRDCNWGEEGLLVLHWGHSSQRWYQQRVAGVGLQSLCCK